jgi:hypothetical protein
LRPFTPEKLASARQLGDDVPMAVDPELKRRIAAGDYVVDPHAVAAAMLRRSADRAEARRLSRMLVAGEVDRFPGRSDEPQSGSRGD